MARGIWKGTLGFGLVSIGVELFAAEAPTGIDLTMLDARDRSPIGYRKYNKRTGESIEGGDIVKGFEVSKGRFVILEPEDLKAANPRASGTIDVLGFVHAGDIDLAFFDKPYVVGALKGSEKAYALFVRALEDTGRVGIAQVVIRTKQHIAAIYPYKGAIMVQLMRYADELRQPSDFGIEEDTAARQAIRPQELKMAEQLVESMATTWDPSEFRDTYRDDLMQLIRARAEQPNGKGLVSSSADEGPPPRVLDLMTALKGSLAAQARGGRSARSAHGARKSTTRSAKPAKQPARRKSARKSA